MQITDNDVLPFNFFMYNGIYTGELKSMRYRIWRIGEKPDFKLMACAWAGPYAYAYVPDEEKTAAEFEYSEEGRLEAVAWLNEQFAVRYKGEDKCI